MKTTSRKVWMQLPMENYTAGEVKELEDKVELDMDQNVVHMKVAAGSRIRNLMTYAMKQMKDPKVNQITWNGSGSGTSKTISCAEILKRKIKGLHQITNIRFKRIEEYWEPKLKGLERCVAQFYPRNEPRVTVDGIGSVGPYCKPEVGQAWITTGPVKLKVNRDVPAITILLSKTPLDPTIAGYQPPGSFDAFWKKGAVTANDASKDNKGGRRPNRGASAGQTGTADSPAFGALIKKKRKRAGKEMGKKTGKETRKETGAGSGAQEKKSMYVQCKSAKDSSQTEQPTMGSPAPATGPATPPDVDMMTEQTEAQ